MLCIGTHSILIIRRFQTFRKRTTEWNLRLLTSVVVCNNWNVALIRLFRLNVDIIAKLKCSIETLSNIIRNILFVPFTTRDSYMYFMTKIQIIQKKYIIKIQFAKFLNRLQFFLVDITKKLCYCQNALFWFILWHLLSIFLLTSKLRWFNNGYI